MDQWAALVRTYYRDDVMLVCGLVTEGIGLDVITSTRKTLRIFGTAGNGKTAVSDGIVTVCSDEHSSGFLSENPLMEDEECDAALREISKTFAVDGKTCIMTLHHDDGGDFVETTAELPGLDFRICLNLDEDYEPYEPTDGDISISFTSLSAKSWHREWAIHIKDPELQTEHMAKILDGLRALHDDLNKRYGARPSEFDV